MTDLNEALSRRDFLKLSGLGLASLSAIPLPLNRLRSLHFDDPFEVQQGRVTSTLLWTYDRPSYDATRLKLYWRDLLLPITNVTVGEDTKAYNRVWYEIGTGGFAYSGFLQPVRTILNAPRLDIPVSGLLAEVSVPFTDAHVSFDATSEVAYRLYYESTHWVTAVMQNPANGKSWYQILDDRFDELYYAQAEHMRFFPEDELMPLSAEISDGQKRIEVHLEDQLVIAYERDIPVFVTRAATGGIFRSGTYTTPTGSFMTYHKRPTRHMAAGDLAASGFNLPGVPWVQYFTETGISLHGTYWHNDFGHPRSHGCINLSPQAAKWLFRWTSPIVKADEQFSYKNKGTLVRILV
jgi:lipoprotein-anchoring transpeptidase ErfK/SrfK